MRIQRRGRLAHQVMTVVCHTRMEGYRIIDALHLPDNIARPGLSHRQSYKKEPSQILLIYDKPTYTRCPVLR
jgi:hypothetical protein